MDGPYCLIANERDTKQVHPGGVDLSLSSDWEKTEKVKIIKYLEREWRLNHVHSLTLNAVSICIIARA